MEREREREREGEGEGEGERERGGGGTEMCRICCWISMINSYTLVMACVEVKEDIVIGWCVNKVECDTSWVRWVAWWGRREQPVH